MRFRTLIVLAIAALLLASTACSIIAPAPTPTPLPVVPSPLIQPIPAPSATLPPAPLGTPTLAPVPPTTAPQSTVNPQPQYKRISFQTGATTATLQGNLATNGEDIYVVRVLAGQTLSVTVTTSAQVNILLGIGGADGLPYKSMAVGTASFSWQMWTTQDYYIAIATQTGAPAGYTLQVWVPPLGTDWPQRISFPAGGTTATIQGATAIPGSDRFVIRALAGQTMSVNISATQGGPAILIIYAADGNVLISDHAGATSWSGTLPTTQDYFIDTRSVGNAVVLFTLTVTIPPLGAEAPTPTPKRISFPSGGTTATVQSALAVNDIDRWVLGALAGQTMTVNTATTQGQVILIIWGVQDGNVLISDHAGATSWTGQLPSTEDYYIDVRSVGNVAANYTLQVTIPPK